MAKTARNMRKKPVYGTWNQMLQRCTNPRVAAYPDYGGRGITVDPAWRTFAGFYADMGDPPAPGLTLDRIDNDGPYSKANCRWATRLEQAANRRGLRLVTFAGRTQSVRRWAAEVGMGYLTLYTRLFRDGWSVEAALTTPVNVRKRNRHAGTGGRP